MKRVNEVNEAQFDIQGTRIVIGLRIIYESVVPALINLSKRS
ncbi:hypothetical protein [Sporosarcina sp. P3]|nr:hypothetical protein [Sporosarcina sp. P3]